METYVCPEACYYCGEPADSVDHVPPKSERLRLISAGVQFEIKDVMSCRECNSVLGKKPLYTLAERKSYICDYLKYRYARYLNIPHWSKSDLENLGESLRRDTILALEAKKIAKRRIAYARKS